MFSDDVGDDSAVMVSTCKAPRKGITLTGTWPKTLRCLAGLIWAHGFLSGLPVCALLVLT